MTVKQRAVVPVLVLTFSAVMWGLTWWPLKYFNGQGLEGVPLILFSYGIVGLVLLPTLWLQRAAWRGEGRFLWLMLLFGGYSNLAFANAMIYGDVVRAMMLFYLAPVWGVIGGRLFLGEAVDGRRWFGVGLAIAGAFLVLGGSRIFAAAPSWVDLLALSAGMTFATNNIACRAAQKMPLGTKTAAVFVGCGVMALALMPLQSQPLPSLGAASWGWLLLFGLGWLLLATLTTQWGVTHMEAGRASVILISELVAAVGSATLLGGESLAPGELIGGGMILTAALLEARRVGDEVALPEPGGPGSVH